MKAKSLVVAIALALFALLFIGRLAVELSEPPVQVYSGGFGNVAQMSESSIQSARVNVASAKVKVVQAGAAAQLVEQKYERVSRIETQSEDWDADRAELAAVVDATGAIVQTENAWGLEGERVLSISLGVVPESFDELSERLSKIGELESLNVTKTDRTGDFRALEARRLSLEKTRDGLAGLRGPGAELADRVELESKILEIEAQIQELGVSLGDYSESNSFCTVHLTLREAAAQPFLPRLLRAALAALGWTVAVYAGLAVAALSVLGIAALLEHLVARVRDYRKAKQA